MSSHSKGCWKKDCWESYGEWMFPEHCFVESNWREVDRSPETEPVESHPKEVRSHRWEDSRQEDSTRGALSTEPGLPVGTASAPDPISNRRGQENNLLHSFPPGSFRQHRNRSNWSRDCRDHTHCMKNRQQERIRLLPPSKV